MKVYSTNTSSGCIVHHGKKGVKWDINYNFSEKTTMTIAAETILREDVIENV
jgi:hypothetical protein